MSIRVFIYIYLLALLTLDAAFLVSSTPQGQGACNDRKDVYFLLTSLSNGGLNNVTKCAIRSACVLNAELTVHVLLVDLNMTTILQADIEWIGKRGCERNLVYSHIDMASILQDTPFMMPPPPLSPPLSPPHGLPSALDLSLGPFAANNQANAARLALLYKHG